MEPPIPKGTVLDGELVVTDSRGRPDFEWVMKRLKTRDQFKIQRMKSLPVQYVVFDILYYRGESVMDRPLIERKALLKGVLREDSVFSRMTKEDRKFVHVEPRIHCRVKYKKWTHAGYLREPVFQSFAYKQRLFYWNLQK